jgi:PAS domain S-box-containing protein
MSTDPLDHKWEPAEREMSDTDKVNKRRLNLLLDNLPARIAYIGPDERFVFVNRVYESAYGLTRGQIIGKTVATLVGPDNYLRLKPYIHKVLGGKIAHFEMSFSIPAAATQWIAVDYVPDINSAGEVIGFYSLVLDHTEKKRAQEEKAELEYKLQQTEKLEAIGTLAGGIAHDFNNILMGILGRASLLSVELETSSAHLEHIQAIEECVRSATNLTRQLLGITRGGKYQVKPIDINELVDNSAAMFGRTKKELHIHTRLDPSLPVVDADKGQIEQVLLNLYVNAGQAMPGGGDLKLETQIVTLNEAFCRPHGIEPGPYTRLSVTDTGIGMDSATCKRVFDPFFTTKEKSRGTGLGLASAYGIVKNHAGIITVDSKLGRGTTFNIYLPLSNETSFKDATREIRSLKGSETILLVDDEAFILDVGRAMLEKLGYVVILANSGERAIDEITRTDRPIDLVILDVIMPGMDGSKTFDRIREIQPDLPVMLSSGYSLSGQAADIIRRGCKGFIQKPFNISELSYHVRRVLESVDMIES